MAFQHDLDIPLQGFSKKKWIILNSTDSIYCRLPLAYLLQAAV